MADYIEREAIYKETCKGCIKHGIEIGSCFSEEPCEKLIMAFVNAPSADVAPVRHGRWLSWDEKFPEHKVERGMKLGVFCSLCELHADNKTDFCPNCGAKMV